MQPTSRALKLQARNAMSDTNPSFWAVTLLYVLLVSILPSILYEIFDADLITLILNTVEYATTPGADSLLNAALMGLFITLVVQLVSMVIQLGYSLWALRCWRREEENSFPSLFEGFGMVGRLFLCNLLVAMYIAGWSMLLITALSTVLTPVFLMDLSGMNVVLLIFYSVTAFVASFLIYLRYTLVPFVLLDRPELGVLKVISLAVAMMRQRLWAMFRLYFSFFWWYLLSFVLSTGISLLVVHLSGQLLPNLTDYVALLTALSAPLPFWLGLAADLLIALFLTPYVTVTVAGFYDSLIQPQESQPTPYNNDIYS